MLENEFKGCVSELQCMEGDLQFKMQCLQFMKLGVDCIKLEKDVMVQCQIFFQKVQVFEQDCVCCFNEECGKLVICIQIVVQSVVKDQSIDLVVDVNVVVYNSSDVKDIIVDVLKQVK